MKPVIPLLIGSLIATSLASPFGGLGDFATGGINIGKSIGKKIPDLIPGPESIFRATTDTLLGYPFEVVATAINKFCSVALSGNGTVSKITPDVKEMKLVFFTPQENATFPLLEAERLWSHPSFNNDWNLTVFVTGWTTDLTEQDTTVDTVLNAYRARGQHNFVVLDSARYVDTLYTWSAFNTEEIGDWLGKALAKLVPLYPVNKMHVIGHSLGSHISGAAGRSFAVETGLKLPRITGLDPANPCFNEGESLSGLQRGDADFVDVIHTNNNVLGKRDPIGDVDFYPNGVTAIQPGCIIVSCAHARSWHYYAETVYPGNENNFPAVKCNSVAALNTKRCPSTAIPMGYATPTNAKGNFFLSTDSSEPYGRKDAGLKAP